VSSGGFPCISQFKRVLDASPIAIFAGVSQFERDLISERTRDGLASARARGRKGGRPPKLRKDIELAIKMYEDKKYTLSEITKATGISKTSLYRYLHRENEKVKPVVGFSSP